MRPDPITPAPILNVTTAAKIAHQHGYCFVVRPRCDGGGRGFNWKYWT